MSTIQNSDYDQKNPHPDEFRRGRELADGIINNVERVIIGKRDVIKRMLASLVCKGHILIEDIPGVGKTTMVRALSRSIDCDFKRIQFTPDLLPSDITGISTYDQHSGEFRFQQGPIFSQIVLADEINRTSPKTQSSLLECMEEGQVTIDGITHRLPEPFLVLATQNPIEYEGTFPLPEAQLDRFLIRVTIGYPAEHQELQILAAQTYLHPIASLEPVIKPKDILSLQELVTHVAVDDDLKQYIVSMVHATRRHNDVYLGASPRGSLGVFRMARAMALLSGRDYVIPDDIKQIASTTLCHRILLRPESSLQGKTPHSVVEDIIHETPVPMGGGNG